MKLTGARILMECLREQKVDTIFGYPGGTILNVYDALYDYKEITHILTSHEQGAAHAADGYARSHRQGGRVLRHLRPRRHQPDHRHRHRVYGLLPRGVYHLQRGREPASARTPSRRWTSPASPCPSPSATYLVRDVDEAGGHGAGGLRHGPHRPPRSGGHRHHSKNVTSGPSATTSLLPLEEHAASGASGSPAPPGLTSSLKTPEPDHGRYRKAAGDDRGRPKSPYADLRRRRGPQGRCPRGVPAVCPSGSTPRWPSTVMGGGGVSGGTSPDHRHDRHARLPWPPTWPATSATC